MTQKELEYRIEKNYLDSWLKSSYFEIFTKDLSEDQIDLLIRTFQPKILGTWLTYEEKSEILAHGYYPIDLSEYSEEEIILKLAILGYEAVKTEEKKNFKRLFDIQPVNLEDIL